MEEPEPATAPDASVNVQSGLPVKRVIDSTLERLEGIAESHDSPHGTIDERVLPVNQDAVAITEKVSFQLYILVNWGISAFQ